VQALFYGPVNLVGRNSATEYLELGQYRNAGLSGDLLPSLTPVPGAPLPVVTPKFTDTPKFVVTPKFTDTRKFAATRKEQCGQPFAPPVVRCPE
jgi:hypothetical protein